MQLNVLNNFHTAGDVQAVNNEINNGVDADIKNELALTPLYVAVENGKVNYSFD